MRSPSQWTKPYNHHYYYYSSSIRTSIMYKKTFSDVFFCFSIETIWMLVIEWRSRAVWCSHSFAIFFFLCLFVCYFFAIGNGSISMSCELLRMTFKMFRATRNKSHLLSFYTINIQIVILFPWLFFPSFFPQHMLHLMSSNQMKQPDVFASNIFPVYYCNRFEILATEVTCWYHGNSYRLFSLQIVESLFHFRHLEKQ